MYWDTLLAVWWSVLALIVIGVAVSIRKKPP